MEKKLRRLLVLLATVVLLVCALTTGVFATEADEPVCYTHGDLNSDGKITHRDAIHLLYASFDNESYALNQSGDFTGDGKVTEKDAFYLLYASFGDEDCPLEKERIHIYSEPVWNWIHNEETDEYGVTAKFTCECGESKVESDPKDVTVKDTKIDATCTKVGSRKLEAALTLNGKTYTSRQEQTLEMIPHEKVGELSCLTGVTCKNCDYEVEALGHSWVQDAANSKAATCSAKAVTAYACENCEETKTETAEGFGAHNYVFEKDVADGCKHDSLYKCTICDDEEVLGTYYQHTYTAKLTKEANCSVEGEKTYTCSCGDFYTETVPTNDSHTWVAGAAEEGVTTYSCACGESKTVVVAVDTAVAVAAADELQLENDAAVALDEATKEQLGEDTQIKVSVDVVTEDVGLSDAQKEQIGDNPVYDFNMISVDAEGNKVDDITEFAGAVTVTLPYTLEVGEDIDSIAVWYIDDNGQLTSIDATYSNGCVTFTTTHFSYYTVTRLTAEERCARYGHALKTFEKAASCTAAGYEKVLCTRCGEVQSSEDFAAKGHAFDVTITDKKPTCTATGLLEKACSDCSLKTSEVIPALGHKITTETKNATCEAAGETHIKCENCDLEATEILAKLNHAYGAPEIKEATCTEGGYVKTVCADCGYESISGETPALGHAYEQGENAWVWNKDYSAATVTLVCANDEAHTKELNAVVTIKTVNATCTEVGYATYTATAAYGGKTYTATKSVSGTEAAGHKPAAEWSSNAAEHYHVCSVCKEKLGAAAHNWGAESVIKAPTCTTVGTAKIACTICGYETEKTLPATGEHTYVNGVCTGCGHKEDACEHLRVYKTEIDLSGYNICEGQIWKVSCDCGEKTYPNFHLKCNLIEDENGVETTLPDGTEVTIWTAECPDCDLKVEYSFYNKVDEVECALRWYEYYKVSANGTVLVEGTFVSEPMEEHPYGDEPVRTFNMADYGMCPSEVEVYECPCGFSTGWANDGGCDWVAVEGSEEDLNGDGILSYTFECSKCGAIRERDEYSNNNAGGCERFFCEENTYYVNGEVVLELNSQHGWTNHDYICESYELDGASCMDGLLYTMKCQKCGDVNKRYVEGHYEILRTIIDLPDDVCTDALIQYTCPCGAGYGYWEMIESGCDWVYNEENGVKTHTCRTCGLTQTTVEEQGEKDEFCSFKHTEKRIFADKNGNHLATVFNSWMNEEHNMVLTAKLLVEGGKCTDGVEISSVCADCGYYWSNIEYDHMGMPVETYDLSHMGMCSQEAIHYTCACGESDWISFGSEVGHCNWYWSNGGDGFEIWVCRDCDATRKVEREELERIDPCHVKSHYTYTITTNAPDPVVIDVELVDTIHGGESFDLVLQDAEVGCDGGVQVYMNCTVCGAREDHGIHYGHGTWPMNTTVICEEGLCGVLKRVDVSCACGYEQWTYNEWEGGQCDFQHGEWDEELQMNISRCVHCGAIRTRQSVETPVEGETCRFNAITTYTFYDQDKNVLCSYEMKESGERHDEVCTFRMNGDTCQDGYYVDRTCRKCGWVSDYEEYRADCETWRTAQEDFCTTDCGKITVNQWSCPCGREIHWHLEGDCEINWMGWDEMLDMEIGQCTKCGQKVAQHGTMERIPGTCNANRTDVFIALVDDVEVNRVEKTYTTQHHEYVYSYQLQGDTCDDGYTLTGECAYCGDQEIWDGMRYGHEWFQIGYYNLVDYGLCSGVIRFHGCPCGQDLGWGHDNWNCDYDYIGVDDAESGLPIKQCNETGIYFVLDEIGEVDRETCTFNGTYYLKVFGNDYNADPVLNVSFDFSHDSHTYKASSLTLLNPEGTCEDGVTAVFACEYCGESGEETYYEHRHWATDVLDLDQYADTCGGELRIGGCACGWETFFHEGYNCRMETVAYRDETDANGVYHEIWDKACPDCGLSFVEDRYEVADTENCQYITYWDYTFFVNDVEIKTFQKAETRNNHEFLTSGVLLGGATTCEGGVLLTGVCQRCGEVENRMTESHEVYKESTMDLSQYGAVCGETNLDHYTCACGAYERYNFSNDHACDVDWQSLTESEWWVADVINDHQETSEGGRGAWSNFYNLKCAVSDPACGLNMKMAEYWLKDGCQVTEYQHWQILNADGSVAWDSGHITTGETMGFHDYTKTENQEYADDGSHVNTYSYVCNDCGSTYEYQDSFNSDGDHIKFEGTAINKLDNGENQKWYRYWIREDVYNGYYEIVEDYDEWLHADGETYWTRYEYTYDYPNSCTQTCHYTNSNGMDNTWTNDAHVDNWYNDRREATCTQFGYYEDYGYCDICGTRWSEYYEEYEPTCHNWSGNDTDGWYCTVCGLESTQGASGAIVMEDLSGYYREGMSYIVGYWNRGDIEFVTNVCVVMEDQDYEEILSVNVYELGVDGVTAKYCNKDEVITAAEATLAAAGCTGEYAIRITFVPVNYSDSLDYAITFDSMHYYPEAA